MKLIERVWEYAKTYNKASLTPGASQEYNELTASIFSQVYDWMKKAQALLGEARCYVSCDIHSNEDYGPEARKLYDELCLFGADMLDRDPAWSRGVQDSFRIVNDQIERLSAIGWTGASEDVRAKSAVGVLRDVNIALQAMLARGSYKDKSSALMAIEDVQVAVGPEAVDEVLMRADEHGNFPPSTKCYNGEDMVGDPEGDGKYESTIPCLGRHIHSIDGDDYDCDYPHAGHFGCEDCVVNGGRRDPRVPPDEEEK